MVKKGVVIIKLKLKSIVVFFLVLSLCACSAKPAAKQTVKNTKSKVSAAAENKDTSSGKQSFVVCIDPGHGAYDKGTSSSNGVLEKDVNLKVGLKVGQILEKKGIKVVYTREDDKTILGKYQKADLMKRVQISEDSHADIFVSIHCNYFKDPSTRGIEVFCNYPNTKGEELAKEIMDELYKANYTVKRDIKYKNTSPLYVLKHNTAAAAALVEIGYLSNTSDCQFISSDYGQARCARAIADAILNLKSEMSK